MLFGVLNLAKLYGSLVWPKHLIKILNLRMPER